MTICGLINRFNRRQFKQRAVLDPGGKKLLSTYCFRCISGGHPLTCLPIKYSLLLVDRRLRSSIHSTLS